MAAIKQSMSPRFGSAKDSSPVAILTVAVTIFLVSTFAALMQPPRLFPLKPDTFWEWWFYPVEHNAFQRMPLIAETPRDVFVVPGTRHVWIVGDKGLVLDSPDSGITWKRTEIDFNKKVDASWSRQTESENPTVNLAENPGLISVFFSDSDHGWIVGDHGTILTTVDGGKNWELQDSKFTHHLRDVFFLSNNQMGWAVGGGAEILASTDGGNSWEPKKINAGDPLMAVHFSENGKNGLAGGSGGTILVTNDGGNSWKAMDFGGLWFKDVHILADGKQAWAVGSGGRVLFTADGGYNWISQEINTNEDLESVQFLDDGNRGWIAGDHGTVFVTIDGGKHWKPQDSDSRNNLLDLHFAENGLQGWAIYLDGMILGTTDGGKHWEPQIKSRNTSFNSVKLLADGQHGWTVGVGGHILTTIDGGINWKPQESSTKADLYNVYFLENGEKGWIVGDIGTVLTSSDGGKNWIPQDSKIQSRLNCVQFLADGQKGWVAGMDGIWASANGGKTWHSQDSYGTPIACFQFLAKGQKGWAVGATDDGKILATSDGGEYWEPQVSNTLAFFQDVYFMSDGRLGWVAGEGGIFNTSDGGNNWKIQFQFNEINNNLAGLQFLLNGQIGWSVGNHGTILATVNGGKDWVDQDSRTHATLNDVYFLPDGQHGWVVGDYSTLLDTEDGGTTWSPVEYHRYFAPWYFLVCLLSLTLAGLGTRRPQPHTLSAGVADLLASDRPLDNPAADALGYADIAAGLSRFLRNPKTLPPLTVAVTGEWGSGKSSLMNLLKADLKKAGFRTVWFNAWHHQKGEQLLASLFANLRTQAIPSWFSRAGWSFRWKLLYRRSLRHAVLLVVLAVLLSFSLGYLVKDFPHVRQLLTAGDWAKLNRENLGALSPLLGSLAVLLTGLVALFNAVKGFGLDPAKLMATVSAGGSKLKPLEPGARYQFAEEFADVTEALTPGRLVIFIDDLDRCSKENVLEVLESVNFLVSSGGCFVVLGMAREWVETCVGLNFKELAEEHNHGPDDKAYRVEFARKYLQKLINIEVPVPKLDAGDSLRLMPDEQALPETGNRLQAMVSATLLWLGEARQVLLILLLLAVGLVVGQWLAPQIGSELDWVGGKLNGATAKPPPVEIPWPANLDAKLAGSDGGLGIASPSQAKNDYGQLLLRADPADLDKGVVLGKLGGAELVLKRPTVVEPEFVGPIKPSDTDPRPVNPQIPPDQKSGESFTPGATEDPYSPWRIGPSALMALVLMGFGLVLLLRSPVKLTEDSDKFMEALKTWHPLIAASCPTPRMVKRYLNWVRFLAMRYRPLEPEVPGILQHLGLLAKPEPSATETEKVFDEDILVALSAIYQYRREWVLDEVKFEQIKVAGPAIEFTMEEIDAINEQDKMAKKISETEDVQENMAQPTAAERLRPKNIGRHNRYKQLTGVFASLTPEDWQKAAAQRERFIDAVGDVDVA